MTGAKLPAGGPKQIHLLSFSYPYHLSITHLPTRILFQVSIFDDCRLRDRVVILAAIVIPDTRIIVRPSQITRIRPGQSLLRALSYRNRRTGSRQTGRLLSLIEDHVRRTVFVRSIWTFKAGTYIPVQRIVISSPRFQRFRSVKRNPSRANSMERSRRTSRMTGSEIFGK